MSERLQPVRGTQDLLNEDCARFRQIDDSAWTLARRYGCQEIRTPIFEFSEVFHRTLGETSDMVAKETYTFLDRGNESITLRPEGTAGIARAFISNGLAQHLPLRFYYSGPMFRYERPQKGRYRQFHQIGVEYLGFDDAWADVECIALAAAILRDLGLENSAELELNSLGDTESRQKHRGLLVEYLEKYEKELSPDSQVRLKKNPLRILDSKDANDQKILQGAPGLESCLNPASKVFAEEVQKGLELLKIPFRLNARLVRGIDYYTHTVFEFITKELGAQGALVAGGRYNGLIRLMGGPETAGVGWAAGMERLSLLLAQRPSPQADTELIVTLAADEAAEAFCFQLAEDLRRRARRADHLRGGALAKKMKKAAKMGATEVLIAGATELYDNKVTVKNMRTGDQRTMDLARYLSDLKA